MSKLMSKAIRCLTSQQGIPSRVEFQGTMIKVADVMEIWADTGQWWLGESEKKFFRLQLQEGPVMEIYQDLANQEWRLYKVYD